MCAQNHRWGVGPIQTCKSGPKVTVLHEKKIQVRAGTHIGLSFWCKSRCFACTKRQVRSGTHRDSLFGSKTRCFACKNHRWGLEPIETSANHALVHVQNVRSYLGNIETCYSDPEVTVLHAKTTGEVLDTQKLVILILNSLFCMHKTTGEDWKQYSLFVLVLSTLLWVLKTADEVWDPYRLVSLVLKLLFCMHKTTDEGWNSYSPVILVQMNLFWMLKTTGEVWDPWRLVILVQNVLFWMQKPQMRAGTHRDRLFRC